MKVRKYLELKGVRIKVKIHKPWSIVIWLHRHSMKILLQKVIPNLTLIYILVIAIQNKFLIWVILSSHLKFRSHLITEIMDISKIWVKKKRRIQDQIADFKHISTTSLQFHKSTTAIKIKLNPLYYNKWLLKKRKILSVLQTRISKWLLVD